MASLENVKARLYSFNIGIAVLADDTGRVWLATPDWWFFPDRRQPLPPVSRVRDNACRVQHAEQQTSVDHFGT